MLATYDQDDRSPNNVLRSIVTHDAEEAAKVTELFHIADKECDGIGDMSDSNFHALSLRKTSVD